jgi:hypothetical protein
VPAAHAQERQPPASEVGTPVTKGVTAAVGAPGLGPAQLLALQRSIGNHAVGQLLQRKVRVDGGKKRVDEAYYKTGKGKSLGLKRPISSLIDDPLRRVFEDASELEDFANGFTDHIGEVVTQAGDIFWFRLPKDKLTVLGEYHDYKDGNVLDVVRGLRTSRFMYEPFNEMTDTKALGVPFTGTQARLEQANKDIKIAKFADRTKFDPDLENIVIKALTGASIARNEFFSLPAKARDDAEWKARASTSDYSMGERVALYLSFGMHIAADLSKHDFGPVNYVESPYVRAGRVLKDTYLKYQAELDAFMKAKDADQLIGIYDLTAPGGFANEAAIKAFTLAFHEYGSLYIKQLGTESGSADLEKQGEALRSNLGAKLDDLSPVRETMMWQKIQGAKGYLLVGVGDDHRKALTKRLDAAGIPHARVDLELRKQKDDIKKLWAS